MADMRRYTTAELHTPTGHCREPDVALGSTDPSAMIEQLPRLVENDWDHEVLGMLRRELYAWPVACEKFGFKGNVRFAIPEVRVLWNDARYKTFDDISDPSVKLAFHATNWDNLPHILQGNFDPSRSRDGWYGNGTYFTTNMLYSQHYIRLDHHNGFRGKSDDYALQLPDVGNTVWVLGVLLKVGNVQEVTNMKYRNKPCEPGYDSHHAWVSPAVEWSCGFRPVQTKDESSADEYIMFDKDRICPRFLIGLKRLEDGPPGDSDFALQHQFLDCAKAYDWDGVKRLLEVDPRIVNCQPGKRWSALHQAVGAEDCAIVRLLVAHRADPDLKNRDDQTPLQLARKDGVRASLKGTCAPGVALDGNDGGGGYASAATPLPTEDVQHEFLNYAKNYDWDEVKEEVRKHPSIVNATPSGRWSALHQAAEAGQIDVVEWLLSRGASKDVQNRQGQTPKEVATDPLIQRLL